MNRYVVEAVSESAVKSWFLVRLLLVICFAVWRLSGVEVPYHILLSAFSSVFQVKRAKVVEAVIERADICGAVVSPTGPSFLVVKDRSLEVDVFPAASVEAMT